MNITKLKKSTSGFSLVELIVAMAIMAVLAALLIPAFLQVQSNSRYKRDVTQITAINTAIKQSLTDPEVQYELEIADKNEQEIKNPLVIGIPITQKGKVDLEQSEILTEFKNEDNKIDLKNSALMGEISTYVTLDSPFESNEIKGHYLKFIVTRKIDGETYSKYGMEVTDVKQTSSKYYIYETKEEAINATQETTPEAETEPTKNT